MTVYHSSHKWIDEVDSQHKLVVEGHRDQEIECWLYRMILRLPGHWKWSKVSMGRCLMLVFGSAVANYSHRGCVGCKCSKVSPPASDRNIAPLWRAWRGDQARYLGEVRSKFGHYWWLYIPCLLMVSP
jgi:hypothetical protein